MQGTLRFQSTARPASAGRVPSPTASSPQGSARSRHPREWPNAPTETSNNGRNSLRREHLLECSATQIGSCSSATCQDVPELRYKAALLFRYSPAHPRMLPTRRLGSSTWRAVPRAHRDSVFDRLVLADVNIYSPRLRGCSRLPGVRIPIQNALPAPAGMYPTAASAPPSRHCAPRTHGDVPISCAMTTDFTLCPRTCGDVPNVVPLPRLGARRSPRLRGCSRAPRGDPGARQLLPAPEVMFPRRCRRAAPARAAPRARGDVPIGFTPPEPSSACSPHLRGCSPSLAVRAVGLIVLHAPARMVPPRRTGGVRAWRAPRTRGDVPGHIWVGTVEITYSPHQRGCSRVELGGRGLFYALPAPAGMFLTRSTTPTRWLTAPRALGGCSHQMAWSRLSLNLLPSPAGVFPSVPQRVRPV